MILKVIFSLICFNFFFIENAFAYIDPGTGSIILHAILAFFATCFAWLIAKYNAVKMFLKKKFYKNKNIKK